MPPQDQNSLSPNPAPNTPDAIQPDQPVQPTQPNIAPNTPLDTPNPVPQSGIITPQQNTDSQFQAPVSNMSSTNFQPTQPAAPEQPAAAAWPPTDAEPMFAPPKKSGKKKFIILAIILGVLIVLAGSAYTFAFYIPNRPENVWNSGVNRSGQALKSLAEKSTEKIKTQQQIKSDVLLDIEASMQEQTYKGSFAAQFDERNTNGTLTFSSTADGEALNVKADIISKLAKGKQLPDNYVRLTGLKQLTAMELLPVAYGKFDNKWISINADYLESMLSPQEAQQQQEQLSAADIAELANAFTTPTLDRVFSTEANKAVFENREFIGKEDVDGKEAYHYKVGINKTNYVSYCKAVVESIMSTSAYQKTPLSRGNMQQEKDNAFKNCDNSDNEINEQDTFDVWIDSQQKILYKARITNKDQQDTYVDIGQNYNGGDTIEFFARYHDGPAQTDANFTLTSNINDGNTSGKLTVESKQESFPYSLTISLGAKPFNGEIDATEPKPSVPIQRVLRALGLE